MMATALDRLPTEILSQIIGELPVYSYDDGSEFKAIAMPHTRDLRLVNRAVSAVASSFALRTVPFVMGKRDFRLLEGIANHEANRHHVIQLMYHVRQLDPKILSLERYTTAIKTQMLMDSPDSPFCFRTECPDQDGPQCKWVKSDDEIHEDYQQYLRIHQQQQDILDKYHDYEVLRRVVAKLPRLRNLTVSSCQQLGYYQKPSPVLPWRTGRSREVYLGRYDTRAAVRHLHALLHGVQEAGTRLQHLSASKIYFSLFEPDVFLGPRYGLHTIFNLFDNLTNFSFEVKALDECSSGRLEDDDQDYDEESQIKLCRMTMAKGILRRILDNAPNLATIDLRFTGDFEPMTYHDGPWRYPCFTAAAKLGHVLPLNRVYPHLHTIYLMNMETERQEIGRFLFRHKKTLKSFTLEDMVLKRTSWVQLIRDLRDKFHDAGLKRAEIRGLIRGVSEDEEHEAEIADLGIVHGDPWEPTSSLLSKYITSPEPQPKGHPLEPGYIYGFGDDDSESSLSNDDSD
ncbi:hypothetical protein QBC34DRAFT_61601 [Podospora aff. communis PSN243]|uniref:F-box domain-containing protein n=1 Tax=Podospora aff. communis PSN243 TaxID=3040156 RepID=A0AAV9GRY6_9PEZI|nr:hypothetical protein QBC34DRAFT_61601 [Podospora aff. communis PSN243]